MPGLRALGRQLSRYSAIGIVNTLIGGALIYTMHNLMGFGIVPSNVIGYGAGLVLSYAGNRYWTFGNLRPKTAAPLIFALLVGAAFAANLGMVFGTMRVGLAYNPAQLLGIITYSGLVFLGMKFLVFTDQTD